MQLDAMLYSEIRFRGNYILNDRERTKKDALIAASFSAYQLLAAKVEKLPTWSKYLKQIGLSNEPRLTKADLKREAAQAMENAQRIIDKANATGNHGSR